MGNCPFTRPLGALRHSSTEIWTAGSSLLPSLRVKSEANETNDGWPRNVRWGLKEIPFEISSADKMGSPFERRYDKL